MRVSVEGAGAVDQLRRELGSEYQNELAKIARRTLGKVATRAWNAAKQQARLERSDRRRRVYVRRTRTSVGAKFWLGFAELPAHRLSGGYVSGTGRQTRIEGALIPGVFRPRVGGPVFERDGRSLSLYRVALNPVPIEGVVGDLGEQYESDVLRVVDRLLRGE